MGKIVPSIGRRRWASLTLIGLTVAGLAALGGGTPTRGDIITGLQGLYDFNSAATVGTDTSGNNNNGTLSASNAAFFNDPTRGGVLKLTPATGAPGFVQVPDSPSLAITGDMTISAYVNLTNYSNFNGIVGKTTSNQPSPYDYYLAQSTGLPVFFRGNGVSGTAKNVNGATAVGLGQWHQVAVTMTGTTVSHYLDGVLQNSGTLSTTIANGNVPLYIGSRQDGATALNGLIDDVRIYNRGLTAADITELYAATSPEPVSLSFLAIASMGLLGRMGRRARRFA